MSTDSPTIRARCPAKLNLGLRVTGQRPDGYHELDTLFCAVDLFDELRLRRRSDRRLELRVEDHVGTGLEVPATEDNLVCRALRAFAGPEFGFDLELQKSIPSGGGLGGGSSDAAAALRCAARSMGRDELDPELRRIALTLGADVPFLLEGGLQRAEGVGERLMPQPFDAPLWFVLVLPPFGTSTATVFRRYAQHRAHRSASCEELRVPPLFATGLPLDLGNDLEPPAFDVEPRLGQLATAVRETVPDLALSGSGSTLFVARTSAADRDVVQADLEQRLQFVEGGRDCRLIACSGPIPVEPLASEPPAPRARNEVHRPGSEDPPPDR